jgi:hypothetical protein
MHLEPESDLHWTAFLYVAGELSLDEASSFELRLLDDQEARDAVAEAVELAGALAIVGPLFRPKRRSIGRRTLALVGASSLAAAACLVLALVPQLRSIPSAPADASETALAWSSLRGGADADWLAFADGSPTTGPAESGPVAEVESESESEPSTDRALPSWLLSAASAPLDDAPRQED